MAMLSGRGFAMAIALAACLVLPSMAVAPPLASQAFAAEEPEAAEIGTSVVIVRRVTGKLGEETRKLRKGQRVHRNEILETSARSQAELALDDNTKLAMGPGAVLRLDDYVAASSDGPATVALRFLKGAFRFITGNNAKKAYRINTPSATIGVAGTVFDVYVGAEGDTVILLHEGEVEICSQSNICKRHNSIGMIIHAALSGVVSEPLKWASGLIPVVSVQGAFPFVGRRLTIDPVRRLRHAQIIDKAVTQPVKRAGRVLKKGTGTVKRGANRARRTLRKLSPF